MRDLFSLLLSLLLSMVCGKSLAGTPGNMVAAEGHSPYVAVQPSGIFEEDYKRVENLLRQDKCDDALVLVHQIEQRTDLSSQEQYNIQLAGLMCSFALGKYKETFDYFGLLRVAAPPDARAWVEIAARMCERTSKMAEKLAAAPAQAKGLETHSSGSEMQAVGAKNEPEIPPPVPSSIQQVSSPATDPSSRPAEAATQPPSRAAVPDDRESSSPQIGMDFPNS